MHYYDYYYYYYLPKPKWERVQTGKMFSRYTKKHIENVKGKEAFIYVPSQVYYVYQGNL